MSKDIRIELPDELYDRLKELCDHHGQQANLIRKGIALAIKDEHDKRRILANVGNSKKM